MKFKTLLFIAFIYAIPETFDFQSFLLSCKSSGIKLYAESATDSPHGEALSHDGKLIVTLYDKAVPAIPTKPKSRFPGQAGNAVLKGKLSDYRPKLQAIIDAQKTP